MIKNSPAQTLSASTTGLTIPPTSPEIKLQPAQRVVPEPSVWPYLEPLHLKTPAPTAVALLGNLGSIVGNLSTNNPRFTMSSDDLLPGWTVRLIKLRPLQVFWGRISGKLRAMCDLGESCFRKVDDAVETRCFCLSYLGKRWFYLSYLGNVASAFWMLRRCGVDHYKWPKYETIFLKLSI